MHANDIAFGIEIETHMPGNDRTPIGGYHNGLPVAWLPAGWKAERDGSIRTPAGRKPCEFVSPVLRGREGFAKRRDRGRRDQRTRGAGQRILRAAHHHFLERRRRGLGPTDFA